MYALKTKGSEGKTLNVSMETVRKLFKEQDQFVLADRRWGRRVANRTRAPRGAGVKVHRPLERTEIDHFVLDVYVVDENGVPLTRPYLTVIIDCYSRMVLGYSLSLATPNAMTVLETIRHAILPKPPVTFDRQALGLTLDKLPLEEELNWEVAGVMSLVVMDNGADFTSLAVRTGLDELGIEVQYCPPKEPWYKGIIERFGRTMNQKLIHWLPGTTFGKVMRDMEYKAKDKACLTLDDLRQRIELTFWTYNRTQHRGIAKRKPLDVWREGVAQWPILLPPANSLRFEAALRLTVPDKAVHKYGIEYKGEKFNNDALGALWNHMPDKKHAKVMIKIDPEDINYIFVIDPRNDEAFKVPNLKPRAEKISWATKEAAKKRGKALGLNADEHEDDLVKTVAQQSRKAPDGKPKADTPSASRPAQTKQAPKKRPQEAEDAPFKVRSTPEPSKDLDPAALFTD